MQLPANSIRKSFAHIWMPPGYANYEGFGQGYVALVGYNARPWRRVCLRPEGQPVSTPIAEPIRHRIRGTAGDRSLRSVSAILTPLGRVTRHATRMLTLNPFGGKRIVSKR